MMDDKSNVEQPSAQDQAGERRQREGTQVTDARGAGRGRGVQILGGGPRGGEPHIENDEPTLETTVELGGPGADPRDEDGRRIFRK